MKHLYVHTEELPSFGALRTTKNTVTFFFPANPEPKSYLSAISRHQNLVCCVVTNFFSHETILFQLSAKWLSKWEPNQQQGPGPGSQPLELADSSDELEFSSWRWNLSSESTEPFSPLKVLTVSIKISALNLSCVIKSTATFLITIWCLI